MIRINQVKLPVNNGDGEKLIVRHKELLRKKAASLLRVPEKEIQKVEMKDEVPTALLIINKKGEFLDKVSLVDNAKGTVEHMFEYISGNLAPVTFEVYAAEDIKAADCIAPDYYKRDDLIGTITTDDTGIAKLGDLPVGKYYVQEKETAYGYVLDNAPRFVDLSYLRRNRTISKSSLSATIHCVR